METANKKIAEKEEMDEEEPGVLRLQDGDPDFKSAKEKECWQLFKRMSSKGVSVSFETVLRYVVRWISCPSERRNCLHSTTD